jgi:GTP cyclohydrolase II
VVAVAKLPTRFGGFRVVAFGADPQGREHLALVRGDVRGASRVPVRVHSECLTGDVLGSLRCDCRDQLIASLESIGAQPLGVLLYLRQEGRGIGLTNKIRAYALQDKGHDTIEANHLLGFRDDQRDYRMAAYMLLALGVRSVDLMTNNPDKIHGLRENGVHVAGRIPIAIQPNRHNARYLATKHKRGGHWLSLRIRTEAGEKSSGAPNYPTPVSDCGAEAKAVTKEQRGRRGVGRARDVHKSDPEMGAVFPSTAPAGPERP